MINVLTSASTMEVAHCFGFIRLVLLYNNPSEYLNNVKRPNATNQMCTHISQISRLTWPMRLTFSAGYTTNPHLAQFWIFIFFLLMYLLQKNIYTVHTILYTVNTVLQNQLSWADLRGKCKAFQTVPCSHLCLTRRPVLNLDLLQASCVYYIDWMQGSTLLLTPPLIQLAVKLSVSGEGGRDATVFM